MQMKSTVQITQPTRTRVNRISKIRKYISGRFKTFSKLNMQTSIINGVKVYGSRRDIRTLKKNTVNLSI